MLYWKARAGELERVVEDLRLRILALVRQLPADELPLMTRPAGSSRPDERELWYADLLQALDVGFLTISTVQDEMETLWERIGPPEKV